MFHYFAVTFQFKMHAAAAETRCLVVTSIQNTPVSELPEVSIIMRCCCYSNQIGILDGVMQTSDYAIFLRKENVIKEVSNLV